MLKSRFLPPALAMLFLTAPAVQAINVPRQSPELAINLSGGKQVLLSQYQGKVVVVAFILTWCPHCQKTIGYLSKDQTTYGPRGLQVLASAIEDVARATYRLSSGSSIRRFPSVSTIRRWPSIGWNIRPC
jgi:thiol-disulfide isomerase/thioredoxin